MSYTDGDRRRFRPPDRRSCFGVALEASHNAVRRAHTGSIRASLARHGADGAVPEVAARRPGKAW